MSENETHISWRAQILAFCKEQRIWLLWAAIGATAALGAKGNIHYLKQEDVAFDLWLIIYSTLQIFTLEANLDIAADIPFELKIARVLGPALIAFTAWKTFAALFADQLRMLSLRWIKNHVVICGLGAGGYYLAMSFRRNGAIRKNVVIIEPDAENTHIATCKRLGAIVLTGSGYEATTLHSARVAWAESVFALSGDDGINYGIASQTRKVVMSRGKQRKNPLCCHAVVSNLLFAEFAHGQRQAPSDAQFQFHILHINAISARALFNKHPLDGGGIADHSGDTVHLVVVGMGNMGENVAFQAARIGQFANDGMATITVVDREASAKLALYMQMLPGIAQCALWQAVDMDIESTAFIEWLENQTGKHATRLHVAICIKDSSLAVRTALRIQRAFPDKPFQVYVRLENLEGAGAFLSEMDNLPGHVHIHSFGVLSSICACDMIADQRQDELAKAIHEAYVAERTAEGIADDSTVPWELLDHDRKESNRQQADHIQVKMRAIGCEMAPADSARRCHAIAEFMPEEIEILARMEHARWNAERFIAGWKYAQTPDKANRLSPYLVPYDALDEPIKEYDRKAMRCLPALLKNFGLWIYRLK